MSATTKTPTSEARARIRLKDSPFSGIFRPPNWEEMARCLSFDDGDVRCEKVYEATLLEADQKHTTSAKKSLGLQVLKKLSGEELTAEEMSEDDLPDDMAEQLVAKRGSLPGRSFVCLKLDDRPFVFFAPIEGVIDSFLKKKSKARDINDDLRLVANHCVAGDLEHFKREAPGGILELAQKLGRLGGVAVEAELEKL